LNLRTDHRFHFNKINMVVYLSIWNVYDRKNIANYFWNNRDQKKEPVYQWRLLPIFGIELEF